MTHRKRKLLIGFGVCGLLFLAVRSIAFIPVFQEALSRSLTDAVYEDSVSRVVALLIVGASPNYPVHGTLPAIHAAASKNRVSMLKLLLAVGADPNLKTKFDVTPLWEAERGKAEEAARILRAAGGIAYISPNAP